MWGHRLPLRGLHWSGGGAQVFQGKWGGLQYGTATQATPLFSQPIQQKRCESSATVQLAWRPADPSASNRDDEARDTADSPASQYLLGLGCPQSVVARIVRKCPAVEQLTNLDIRHKARLFELLHMPSQQIIEACHRHPGNLTAPIKRACGVVQWLGEPPGPGVLTMGLSREAIGNLIAAKGPGPVLKLSVLHDIIPRVYSARLLGFGRAMVKDVLVARIPVIALPIEEWLRPHVLAIEEHVANGDRTLAVQIVHQCPEVLNLSVGELTAAVDSICKHLEHLAGLSASEAWEKGTGLVQLYPQALVVPPQTVAECMDVTFNHVARQVPATFLQEVEKCPQVLGAHPHKLRTRAGFLAGQQDLPVTLLSLGVLSRTKYWLQQLGLNVEAFECYRAQREKAGSLVTWTHELQ